MDYRGRGRTVEDQYSGGASTTAERSSRPRASSGPAATEAVIEICRINGNEPELAAFKELAKAASGATPGAAFLPLRPKEPPSQEVTMKEALRNRLRVRGALALVAAVGVMAAVAGAHATPAYACDTSYWNIGCQYYSPSEGHTAYQFGPGGGETVWASWDTFDTFLAIATTAGGTWQGSATVYNPPNGFRFTIIVDKYGCYNHHTGTMWVNCRHYDA